MASKRQDKDDINIVAPVMQLRTIREMKMRFVAVSVLLLSLNTVAMQPVAAINFPDRQVTTYDEAPWTARVVSDFGTKIGFCTGVLINPLYVATAAHCLYPTTSLRDVSVTFPLSLDNRTFPAMDVKIHQRYSPRLSWINDIALIRLQEPVQIFTPLKLPPSKDSSLTKKTMRIYGYGIDQNLDAATTLNTLAVTNRSKDNASRRGFNSATMLGVGSYFPKEGLYGGACLGDSGGPLVGYSGKTPVLLGLSSYVAVNGKFCDSRYPSVYTRVSSYLSWMKTTMNDMNAMYDRPNAPSNLQAIPGPDGVSLTWNEPGYKGRGEIGKYNLRIFTANNAAPDIVQLPGTGTVITGLEPGRTYRFSVTACNSSLCSVASEEVTLTLP